MWRFRSRISRCSRELSWPKQTFLFRATKSISALSTEVSSAVSESLHRPNCCLLFEPMAGQGQMLCARAEDLAPYLAAVERHPKAGICLDTCHMFAAGHDLTAVGGVAAMLDELVTAAGPGRVGLVHANDSLLGCGSKRDRHEALGAGKIGTEPFRELLAALGDVPFVVETPGGKAGHARDIATLKGLRAA